MGVLLSIPLIPVQMALSAFGSCAGASISSALCGLAGITLESSLGTRLLYAVLFILNSLLSWLTLTDWAVSKLDLLKYACQGGECTGFIAVHRIQFALAMVHLGLAFILTGIPAAAGLQKRTAIQNGWWRTKFFAWLMFVIIGFRVPARFWVAWGNYVAPIFSFTFIFIGLVLLVDFAHSWAEKCVENIEEGENPRMWAKILIGSTASMYLGAAVLSGIMLWFFAAGGCSMNQAAITINIVLSIIASVLSIHPKIQEYNPRAGLAQSAMVCLYSTYLVMSAVAAEPDDKQCNPLVRSRGTRTASIIIGALFTFLAIAYTSIGAASSRAVQSDPEREDSRAVALRQAVADGTLPASALNDASWEDDSDSKPDYNYVLFHIVFFLATQYTATLLTINVDKDPVDNFVPVGRTYFASWTKIVSSWICYGLYAWSLMAPVVMPDRF